MALKVIKKKNLSDEKVCEKLFREIDNLEVLQHENIVEYYDSFETKTEVYLAMEYLPRGELFDYIVAHGGLNEIDARKMFTQIASAVAHCHHKGISHRDLKLENILLSKDKKPKIVDFGFSKAVHPTSILATYCGSALYASPEMILGKPYRGPECDIWSLGVILFSMLTACMPFDDQDWTNFICSIQRADYPEPRSLSESVKNLISRMLDPCAKTRATIDDVISHPWLNPKPRKSSLQLPVKTVSKRRNGISHSQSIALEISKKLILEEESSCSCKCHHETTIQEYVCDASKHCEDCKPLAEIKSWQNSKHSRLHTLSISSSGYNSMESLPSGPKISVESSKHRKSSTILSDVSHLGSCMEILMNDADDDEEPELLFA